MTGMRSLSGRSLVYGGLVVVIFAALGLFLRGGSSPSASAAKASHQVAVALHHHARHHAAKHGRAAHLGLRHAARYARHTHQHRRSVARPHGVHHSKGFLDQRAYARHILPLLDISARTFGRAESATNAADVSQLGSVCGAFNGQVDLLQQEYAGIPYSRAWYTRVGTMHHWIEGLYHTMLGALQQCQTAASNGDYGAAATAKSDMAGVTVQMQQQDAHARWLANQR